MKIWLRYLAVKNCSWVPQNYTAVCSAMRYIVDPPKSPMEQKAKHPLVSPFLRGTEGGSKRGTFIYCILLQRKALYP